jgi:hypothetical protein
MREVCTESIVTCTDSMGARGERDERESRNASFTHCPCRALVVRQRSMDVSLRRSRGGIPLRDSQGRCPIQVAPSRKPLPLAGLRTTYAYASRVWLRDIRQAVESALRRAGQRRAVSPGCR